MISLVLPTPPSANRIWRTGRRPNGKPITYASPEYRTWLRNAGWEAKMQAVGKPKITGSYRLEIVVGSRGDVDNRIKAVSDLLVDMKITPDDRHCVSVTARKERGRKDCLVVITPEE